MFFVTLKFPHSIFILSGGTWKQNLEYPQVMYHLKSREYSCISLTGDAAKLLPFQWFVILVPQAIYFASNRVLVPILSFHQHLHQSLTFLSQCSYSIHHNHHFTLITQQDSTLLMVSISRQSFSKSNSSSIHRSAMIKTHSTHLLLILKNQAR